MCDYKEYLRVIFWFQKSPFIRIISSLALSLFGAGLLGSLEATKLNNEALIKDQQAELAKLQDRISWLERERSSLQSNQDSMSHEQSKQLKSLDKVSCIW